MDVPFSVVAAAAVVVTSVLLLFWALAGLGRKPSPGQLRRPASGEGDPEVIDQRQIDLQEPALQRFVMPALNSFTQRARRLTPAGWVRALESRLRLAGSPAAWTIERILALKLFLGIVSLIVSVLWITRLSITTGGVSVTLGGVTLALVVSLGLYFTPDLILYARGRERQQIIQTTLPDLLDQMTISVEAGLGFDAALQRTSEAGSGPLVEELRRTLNEIAIGVARKQAFQHLLERTDVPELRHFVIAIIQAEEYGLAIAQVLRVQSRELRVLRRQRAEERAMKIPVKIVLPLVLCIFPSLFVVILVPAMIGIFETLS